MVQHISPTFTSIVEGAGRIKRGLTQSNLALISQRAQIPTFVTHEMQAWTTLIFISLSVSSI